MLLLFRFLITFVVVIVTWYTIPGIIIHTTTEAVFFALVLSAVNALVRPILILLTLPITILTLGLFTLVINVFTFWLASEISYGVEILSFSAAFWGGFIVWVASFFTNRCIWRVNIY